MERVSPLVHFTRERGRTITAPFLNYEVVTDPDNDALKQFEDELKNGKIGGAIFHPHAEDTDPLIMLHAFIGRSNLLRKRKVSYPLQQDLVRAAPVISTFADWLGIEIPQIETSKSKGAEEKGRRQMTRGGLLNATKRALTTVKGGGVFITAPQGGKHPELTQSSVKGAAFVIAIAQREKVPSFPILIADVRLARTTGVYQNEMGFKFFTKHIVTPAFVTTSGDLWGKIGGDPRRLDEINLEVFELMRKARELSLKLAPLFPEPIL